MACLSEADLKALAAHHIKTMQQNVINQKTRLDELKKSYPIESDPLKKDEIKNAIETLDFHLNGNLDRSTLETEADSLKSSGINPARLAKLEKVLSSSRDKIVKDPDVLPAENRIKVLEELYTKRPHFTFTDTAHGTDSTGANVARHANIFGSVTYDHLKSIGQDQAAADLALRSISMVNLSKQQTKNPKDYINVSGSLVKNVIADVIEHHHVFNNVYLDDNGRVAPNSVRFSYDSNTNKIVLDVIPEYWNSAKHGRTTQFIELLEGSHSGHDPVTHIHFYTFNASESDTIIDKIKSKLPEIVTANSNRIPRLEASLDRLKLQLKSPHVYEKQLLDKIDEHNNKITEHKSTVAKHTTPDKNGKLIKKKSLSTAEESELDNSRSEIKTHTGHLDKLTRELTQHRKLASATRDIADLQKHISSLKADSDKIKLNVKFPNEVHSTKQEARDARDALEAEIQTKKLDLKNLQDFLRSNGSIQQQISDTQRKLTEAQILSKVTEKDMIDLFHSTNGFFDFDKGHEESTDYSKSKPKMNTQIHKHNARQALADYKSVADIENLAKKHYNSNLLYNLFGIAEKLAGNI